MFHVYGLHNTPTQAPLLQLGTASFLLLSEMSLAQLNSRLTFRFLMMTEQQLRSWLPALTEAAFG